MYTLGSYNIFSSVGIWVFDVKTRIYCLGIKSLNRTLKKVADAKGGVLFFGISGMMAFCKQADEVLDSEYLDRKGTRK